MTQKAAKQQSPVPDSPQLASITKLIEQLFDLREQEAVLLHNASLLSKEQQAIEEELLPNTMQELNLKEIKTEDGHKLTLKDSIQVSVGGKNKAVVIDWLKEIESDDLVKTTISLAFSRKDHKEAERVAALLKKEGFPVVLVPDVHSGTFTAFLKERLSNGEEIPWTRLSARAFQKAYIKVSTDEAKG